MTKEKPYTVRYAGRSIGCPNLARARKLLQQLGSSAYIDYMKAGLDSFAPAGTERGVAYYNKRD